MDERLAAADAALKAGRADEAIDLLIAVATEEPNQPAHIYRVLLTQLYRRERYEEGVVWGSAGVARYPRDLDLLNLLGVVYRKLKRYPEAMASLDAAAKVAPGNLAVQANRGNVLLDMEDGVRAEPVFTKLVRGDPRNAEFIRQLGRSLVKQGKLAAAKSRFKQALALQKTLIDAWLDIIAVANEEQNAEEAEALLEKALAANPDHQRLHEVRVILMRRAQQFRAADAYLTDLLARMPEAAWVHHQLGATVADYARDRANMHFKRASELAPTNADYLLALIESLERTRSGDEGGHIEAAYQFVERALALKPTNPGQLKVLNEILIRVCAFDELPRLGDFKSLGRGWATTNRHTALLKHLAQVKTLEDRYELLEQHAIWGRKTEADAARNPVRHPAPRAPDGKIRLGLLSSDLRQHPVGYFAQPLFDQVDPRFELYCYSFYQGEQPDRLQQYFASKSTAFHWNPEISTLNAAQMIADDQLDMLIELGGTTHMNRLDLMAYRAAPKQASWMGYPHSAGLSTIDYLITDPYNTPPRRDLLLEKPLMMPHTWIALGRAVFTDAHEIKPGLPQDRNGVITFGTANNPHKYNREMFEVWARVLHETPGSRFLFVRPEGSTPTFRRNVCAEFERGGVAKERIGFATVRGAHMPFYNEIDISLDTFPLTGGTTTTESLWMGVPVVSLIGEAFYERLSYSLLTNSGLKDLASDNKDDFVRTAVALAGDRDRRLALRQTLREQIRSGPLGQTGQFAQDFYDLIAKAVHAPA
ncbi:MAG TPA: tetratricopeptide repeat protein [Phenylobacterium sp.]|jgi:protein O-GlcNAc transferase|uniref:tetratricopeptide repeat protein n=1 Tax=Phenylobacterium sp. TaxID=1871053 RepID=UPI002CF3E9B6|nr:tetratricopeptide repeat protein [Phenylobacterium sp.]HXA39823.1 tetratricopeptide repeat protein [Phenylobacterium sp.]